MASLSLKHIFKIYPGGVRAVSDFNLDIDDKEFIVFVGPSGCGKSTTLRMIAGLEDISAGELYIDDRLVNDVEPKDRDIAMVFQNYALYPHMTVYENMAFGLRLRHMPPDQIDARVQEAASILGIQQLLSRRPKALSGGQRQRVALGRAIVREPKVFLLDEPLSNLDAKLRVQMRTEITKIHHRLSTTFIYVTHDQTEAMTMGTRIVVMKDGIVQQVDTPTCLYDNPANLFVACFLGSPQMNIFRSKLFEKDGKLYATVGDANTIRIPASKARRIIDDKYIGKEVLMGIRPEDIRYEQALVETNPESVIEATVDVIENLGNETILYLNLPGKEDYTVSRVNARYKFAQGENIKLYFAADHVHFFDADTELTIMGVPKHNVLPAELRAENDQLVVRFGNTAFTLSENELARLKDLSLINEKVELGLSPFEFKQESTEEGDVEIHGTIAFTDDYPRYKAVYLEVEGKKNYMIVARPLDEPLTGGDELTVYYPTSKLQLFNGDSTLLCNRTLPTNNAVAQITVKDTNAQVRIGKMKFDIAASEGFASSAEQVDVCIDPNKVTVFAPIDKADTEAQAEFAANNAGFVNGTIVDLDEFKNDATIIVEALGFEDDLFAAHVKNLSGYNKGDKIKLCVSKDSITVGSKKNVHAVIEQKAPETKQYIYVSEKKPVKQAAPEKEEPNETAATEAADKEEPKAAAKKQTDKKEPAKKKTGVRTNK